MTTTSQALFRTLLILEFSRSINTVILKSIKFKSKPKFTWSRDTLMLMLTLLLPFRLLPRRVCSTTLTRKMNTMTITHTITNTKVATINTLTMSPIKPSPRPRANSRSLPFLKTITTAMRTGLRLETANASTEDAADLEAEEDAVDLVAKKAKNNAATASTDANTVTKRRAKAKEPRAKTPMNRAEMPRELSAEDAAPEDAAEVAPISAKKAIDLKVLKVKKARDLNVETEEEEDAATADVAMKEVKAAAKAETNSEVNVVPEAKATVARTPELRKTLLRVTANEELTSRFD